MTKLWAEKINAIKNEFDKLQDHLVKMDDTYLAFRKIDGEILEPTDTLQSILPDILNLIVSLFNLESYYIFPLNGFDVYVTDKRSELHSELARLAMENFKKIELERKKLSFRFSKKVFIVLHLNNCPYHLVMFDGSTKRLETDRFKEFIDTASGQLEILIARHHQDKISKAIDDLTALLISDNVDTVRSWEHIIDVVFSFFPSWCNFSLDPNPFVQLLLYTEGDSFLRLAATNLPNQNFVEKDGSRSMTFPTYLLVDESVAGEALKKTEDYILLNPSDIEYREKYKGNHGKISKSKLIVKIQNNGQIFGLLSFEHQDENAFDDLYVRSALESASLIAPFVGAISRRRDEARRKEVLVTHIFESFLERVSDTFQHKLAQPLLIARDSLSEYEYCRSHGTDMAHDEVRKLRDSLEKIQKYSDEFAELLPGFASLGPNSIDVLLKRCISSFESSKYRFEVETFEPGLLVYASSFLGEHLFSIVSNSAHAINEKLFLGEILIGVIRVKVERMALTDSLGEETGIAFVDIYFQDNGGGVKEAYLDRIGRWGFSTKMDSMVEGGFGLAAAREYVEALGGRLTWQNVDDGFEVRMRLQEYNVNFHRRGNFTQIIAAQ